MLLTYMFGIYVGSPKIVKAIMYFIFALLLVLPPIIYYYNYNTLVEKSQVVVIRLDTDSPVYCQCKKEEDEDIYYCEQENCIQFEFEESEYSDEKNEEILM